MSETGTEQPIEEPKPSIKDRLNAMMNTLTFNPGFQFDVGAAGLGVLPTVAYHANSDKLSPIVDYVPIASAINETGRPYAIAGTFLLLGVFGRPVMEAASAPSPQAIADSESNEAADESLQVAPPKSFYARTMIPYMIKAWKTGMPQVA